MAFSFAGRRAWNALPAGLRNGVATRDVSRKNLKTFLFNDPYPVINRNYKSILNNIVHPISLKNLRTHTGAQYSSVEKTIARTDMHNLAASAPHVVPANHLIKATRLAIFIFRLSK